MQVVAKLIAFACAIALLLIPPIARASPPSSPPAPCLDGSLTLTGTNLWHGLQESKIELTLRNGEQLDGMIVAQDGVQLALARSVDGSVVAVPKSEIEGVRVLDDRPAGPPPVVDGPTNDGRKLYGGSIAMLSFGIPLGILGTIVGGVFADAPFLYLPPLVTGLGLIFGGSAALKYSFVRHDAYRKAHGLPKTSKLQLAPSLNVGREGGQLGLVMRF